MDRAYDTFHEVLVKLFNEIMDIEAKAIITPEYQDITNNDMHVIEAIGIGEPRNMSSVAKTLSVTVGTLTIAINNLISLTEKGEKAFYHHKSFHEKMTEALISDLSEEEINALVRALTNLKEFFNNYR